MLRSAPEEMRGRVTNTVSMVAMALAALAPLVAGLLVQHTSGAWAVGAFAATMAVGTVLCLMLRGLRDVDSHPESPESMAQGYLANRTGDVPSYPDADRPRYRVACLAWLSHAIQASSSTRADPHALGDLLRRAAGLEGRALGELG